jgi:hypothetical protein
LFDFAERFKDKSRGDLALFWLEHRDNLVNVLQVQYPSKKFTTDWPEEINDFFILIKLLPIVGRCAPGVRRETFPKAIEKLVVFHAVRNVIFVLYFSMNSFFF